LLKKMLVPASTIKGQETRVTREHAALVKARKATVADIARLTGVSRPAVAQLLKKYAEENEKVKNR
jgi:predicted transcriptional regulator